MRTDERRQDDFAEEMALTGREGVDPRNVWTFHVDVDCPNVRYYCFMGFVPYVGFTYFYSAYMGQTKLGMHHLQHKWWAPALIAISITYTSLLCAIVCRCWGSLSANMTCFMGCPIYFYYTWAVAFVTLVPGYDWMSFGNQFITNASIVMEIVSMVSESILQIAALIFVFIYRERLLKALGIEGAAMVRGGWRDMADPTFREREFIPIKVVITKVCGELPAKDQGSMSNDLFVSLRLGTNERVNTRVHNRTPTREGRTITVHFDEVLQMNLPKDVYSSEELTITLMDQDMMENDEIATKILSVRDIYEKFLTPGSPNYAVDNDLVVSRKGLYFLDANGNRLSEMDSPVLRVNMMFVDDGNAWIGLCILPADKKALDHVKPGGPFAALRQGFGSVFGGQM
jgi:hypothetical protein